jgi:hypothetical protein
MTKWREESAFENRPTIEVVVEATGVSNTLESFLESEQGNSLGEPTVSANRIAQVKIIVPQ